MSPSTNAAHPTAGAYAAALQGAVLTILTLFGGMLLGVAVGNLVFESLPGHSLDALNPWHVTLAAIPALTGILGGGAGWGVAMGRLARAASRRRMALAGLLGFVPITVILTFTLLTLETVLVEASIGWPPVHRIFTLLFVPSAFLIAGISAWAVGLGLNDRRLARRLLWRVGLAAAVAFLAVNVVMEASGWVVGAPRAAERLTMLTVMFAGNLGAGLAGGAVMGWALHAASRRSA